MHPFKLKDNPHSLSLHDIVNQLAAGLMPKAVSRNSFIVNDIAKDLVVYTEKDLLQTVLNNLLSTTVSNTQNNCIRVSAKTFGNIILLHLKDYDFSHDKAIAECLLNSESLAEKLGGCLTHTLNRYKGTTIAFSFYNNLQRAS